MTRHTGCAGTIEPGDRYLIAELPPDSEMGNDRWWRIPVCEPCARGDWTEVVAALFGTAAAYPHDTRRTA